MAQMVWPDMSQMIRLPDAQPSSRSRSAHSPQEALTLVAESSAGQSRTPALDSMESGLSQLPSTHGVSPDAISARPTLLTDNSPTELNGAVEQTLRLIVQPIPPSSSPPTNTLPFSPSIEPLLHKPASDSRVKFKTPPQSNRSVKNMNSPQPPSSSTATSETPPSYSLKDSSPFFRLRFHWVFIFLVIIQVIVCCVVVYYLGDRNARSIVEVLARQIRSEILVKVQMEITTLLVDCLSSADAMYQIIATNSVLFTALKTSKAVSHLNTSYLHPASASLALYPALPQSGYFTPRGIVVLGRRPNLIQGYLGDGTGMGEECEKGKVLQGKCFFQAKPIFNSLIADPEEVHEYSIQEESYNPLTDSFNSTDNPVRMGGEDFLLVWPFNKGEYIRLARKYSNLSSLPADWNPFTLSGDWNPFTSSTVINARLRQYQDWRYQEAVELGYPNPPPLNASSLASSSSFPRTGDLRKRVPWQDSSALKGQLGWTRSFLGLQNQPVLASVRAFMDETVSDGVVFSSLSILYYNSITSVLLSSLKSASNTQNSFPNTEIFLIEKSGVLVASTRKELDAQSQLLERTNLATTTHELLSAIRAPLFDSKLLDPTDLFAVPTPVNETYLESRGSRAYDDILIDESFSYDSQSWHLRATPIPSSVGVQWVIVVCTLNSDFDSGFSYNSKTTAWFTALVGAVCVLVTLLIVQMLTRPLLKLVSFMSSVSARLLDEGAAGRDVMHTQDWVEVRKKWEESLKQPWSVEEHETEQEEKTENGMRRRGGRHSGGEDEEELQRDEEKSHHRPPPSTSPDDPDFHRASSMTPAPSPSPCFSPPRCAGLQTFCSRVSKCFGRWLPIIPFHETQLLHRTFGAMLSGLHTSHDQLQTANESKRRFIRYIFHEVRVPFNAIVLGVEQLREDLYTEPLRPVEEMQDVVNILNEQSKVVARILNDVLSLQKIEDGALQLEMLPFNMIEMVCGTLRSFQPLLAERNLILITEMESVEQAIAKVQFKRETEEEAVQQQVVEGETDQHSIAILLEPPPSMSAIIAPPSVDSSAPHNYMSAYEESKELQRFTELCSRQVIGDRYRLRQVLANMLSNAVKFSEPGGTVTVKVHCTLITEEDEVSMTHSSASPAPLHLPSPAPSTCRRVRIRVCVEDSGRGMAPAELQQMFKPYVQFRSGEQQQGKGTGLGLNISANLIQLHGGEIGVTSEGVPGRGCQFWFELPMEIAPSSGAGTAVAAPRGNVPPRNELSPAPNGYSPMDSPMISSAYINSMNASHFPSLSASRSAQGTQIAPSIATSTIIDSSQNFHTGTPSLSARMIQPIAENDIEVQRATPVPTPALPDYRPPLQFEHSTGTPTQAHIEVITPIDHGSGTDQQFANQFNFLHQLTAISATSPHPSHAPYSSISGDDTASDRGRLDVQSMTSPAVSSFGSASTPAFMSRNSDESERHHRQVSRPSASMSTPSDFGATPSTTLVTPVDGEMRPPSVLRFPSLPRVASEEYMTPIPSSTPMPTRTLGFPPAHSRKPSRAHGRTDSAQDDTEMTLVRRLPSHPDISSSTVGARSESPSQSSRVSLSPSLVPLQSSSLPASLTNSPIPRLGGPRVLVVEDNSSNRKLLQMLLRSLKCDPIGVENGLLALQEFDPSITSVEHAQQLKFSSISPTTDLSLLTGADIACVLMDGNMPVLDGIEATRILRHLGWKVPIIAVTGNALDEDTQNFMSAGASEVLSKPIQRQALERVLTKFLPGFQIAVSQAQQKMNEPRRP
jgi:signal transduction histidine kinase/CheY-like chemotaxis protein